MPFPSDLGYGSCPICGFAIWPTQKKGVYFCVNSGMPVIFDEEVEQSGTRRTGEVNGN